MCCAIRWPTVSVAWHRPDGSVVEALEELQLYAPEAHAPRSDKLLDFDYGRLEHQLDAFLGPRPSWEDLGRLMFSFVNVMMLANKKVR